MKTHPRKNDKGQPVIIKKPHVPTPLPNWTDPTAHAIVVPEGVMPDSIGGIPTAPWRMSDSNPHGWEDVAENASFKEPPFDAPPGLKAAAGVVTIEPDGRIWVVAPTNAFGGYKATFPKGTVDAGASLRTTAVREAYEESGLLVELQAFLIDVPRSLSYTRYYVAKRMEGDPAQMGWESQAVMLVPHEKIGEVLTHPNDKPILKTLTDYFSTHVGTGQH